MAECEEWLLAHLDGRHFDALVECNAAAHRKLKSNGGLNYSVAPKEVPEAEIVTHVGSCLTSVKLEPNVADAVWTKISASLMKKRRLNFNITCEEYSVLDTLRKDKGIVVLPADNGQSTVVLNKVDYDKKVMTLLEDRDTYEVIAKDLTLKIRKRSCGLLRGLCNQGVLSRENNISVFTQPWRPPTPFYGLPKIHKPSVPLRPIVSRCSGL